MDIALARRLRTGSIVHCPADRGDLSYIGSVTFVQPDIESSRLLDGTEYISVHVRGPRGRESVWPSNRLG